MAKKKPKHYCNNKELLNELIIYNNNKTITDKSIEIIDELRSTSDLTNINIYVNKFLDISLDYFKPQYTKICNILNDKTKNIRNYYKLIHEELYVDEYDTIDEPNELSDNEIINMICDDIYNIVDNIPVMSNELGIMFMNISKRLTGHSYFRYYDMIQKEDLVGSAQVRMVDQIDKFDVTRDKANPFAYFTQIAWNCFVLESRNYYKQKNIKRKIAIDCFTHMESNNNIKIDPQLYDSIKTMIDDDDHYTKQRELKNKKKLTEQDNTI